MRQRATALAATPPGGRFHLFLVLPAIAALYAFSFPGIAFVVAILTTYVVVGAIVVWVLRLAGFLALRARGKASGRLRWFVLAPVGGIVIAVILWADAPLRVRWALSRSAFENAATHVADGDSGLKQRVPVGRVGLYRVTYAYKVEAGIIFYEETGSFLDDAGFAFLPGGPTPELANGSFESPEFRSLGGGWYAWTASW